MKADEHGQTENMTTVHYLYSVKYSKKSEVCMKKCYSCSHVRSAADKGVLPAGERKAP